MNHWRAKYPDRIRIGQTSAEDAAHPGKKRALAQAITMAKYDQLLLTDADCVPATHHWLKEMSRPFSEDKKIVLGLAPYNVSSSFLNKVVAYETAHTAMQYTSFAKLGLPYMGVGRNLAYHRSLFYKVNGFNSHEHIASGDDDLFIKEVADEKNTAIVESQNTYCWSDPPANWRLWYKQKQRHLSTSTVYSTKHKVALGLYSITQLLTYGLILYIFVVGEYFQFVLPLFTLRMLLQWIILGTWFCRFKQYALVFCTPIFDFLHVFYYIVFSFSVIRGGHEFTEWAKREK